MKSAFLISAHNNFEILDMLIKTLDYEDNDIYIHIDKKAGEIDYSRFENLTSFSKVVCLRDRMDVAWGDVSQIEATSFLLQAALVGGYDYFHLISGADFPLMSNRRISDFLNHHNGTEFIGFSSNKDDLKKKLGVFHLISSNLTRRFFLLKVINKLIIEIQWYTGIRHFRCMENFYKGCNWWSITEELAQALYKNRTSILQTYKYTSCADEVFLQTYVQHNKKFKKKLYKQNGRYCCMRHIDWQRGNPYTFRDTDYNELINATAFFARKFDSNNLKLLQRIREHIKSE